MSWARLRAELDAWHAAGRTATLWWRDDGVCDWTPALYRLVQIAAAGPVPLALAVPPLAAAPRLAQRLPSGSGVRLLQYGYAGRNHAPPGASPAEYPEGRSGTALTGEVCHGWLSLAELFGRRALPVFVPPWQRTSTTLPNVLAGLGFHGISLAGTRALPERAPGLVAVNVHADLAAPDGTNSFAGERPILTDLIGHLRARRLGTADPAEPTGLRTAHLELEPRAWAFLERLVAATANHPAVRFPAPEVIFARPSARQPAPAPA